MLAVLLFGTSLTSAVLTHAAATEGISSSPAWADPTAMTIRQTNLLGSDQTEPNFLNNLDCQLVSYRLTTGNAQQSGCFTDTGFGFVDTDSDMTIFNGTDEAVQLLPYSPHEVLVPWPGTLDMLAFDAANTGGSYVSLYRDALTSLHDVRNVLGQLTGKQLTRPPEMELTDPSGKPLVVNPQTLAFSSGNSWLVVETLTGSFVRINLATLDTVPFAPSYAMLGSPGLLKSQVAVSDAGHYIAIENDTASSFKVYDLTTCSGSASGLQPENCRSYDYWPFARQQIRGLQSVRHVRFLNDGLISFEALTNDGSSGSYVLAPTDNITSLTDYIGLGDSYTSGEGAFDYLEGTDTADNKCHLSLRSYPLLLTHDLFSAAGGHSVACSGAVIRDVGSTSAGYRGQVRGVPDFTQLQESQPDLLAAIETNFLPGYIAQHRFVKQYQPAAITVSVGGDDIGFGDILERCVEPHLSLHPSDETCFNTYEDRLEILQMVDRTASKWAALYEQLRAESPQTRIYAVGYPEIADDAGSCALNVHLSKSELEFSDELIAYLDNALAQAATKAGITYVDIGQALAGHRLCEAPSYDVAINGLTAGTDGGPFGLKVFGKESYHPNALGQILIEQAILKQTHNLTAGAPPGSTSSDSSQKLLDAPKTGRPINHRLPGNNLASRVTKRGSSTRLSVDGVQNGLQPNQAYTIHLDGPDGTVIGTTTSDSSGSLSATTPIPNNTDSGSHTVDITGSNQAGEPIDIWEPVYVPDSPTDTDGDGIPDTNDSCPAAANSGHDADQDGIDDACDGLISAPPASGSQGNSSSGTSSNSSSSAASGTSGANILHDGTGGIDSLQGGDTGVVQVSDQINGNFSSKLTVTPRAQPSGYILGAGINHPPKLSLRASSHKTLRPNGAVAWSNPKIINWLPWFLIPSIALLLLLLLSLCLGQILKRTDHQTGYA
jgi:hypothetical protein